ncbi:MAG: bifunctional DNA-formamidopyrimidine glycosylase/DNA-(apurinic or apyrimidinic site) lyase [Planctomycetota bacterium]
MPELPEVETMRRGLLPAVGARLLSATRPPCERRPIQIRPEIKRLDGDLRGRQITGLGRRGKRVLFHFDDGQVLAIEPRMTGIVMLADPPTREHLRLRLELSGVSVPEVLFWDRRGLGTVTLYQADGFEQQINARLGPDALEITGEALKQRLGNSRRPVKPALLDQQAVAGIGNLYAAEILFLSKIDPRLRCNRVSMPKWRRIAAATHEVLKLAIEHEGSTLSDGTYRNVLNDPGGFQNYHRVYDREGQTCRVCRSGIIRRIVQTQRSTFFCPVCQRR